MLRSLPERLSHVRIGFLALAALPAFGEATDAQRSPVLEEIVVTGSRIVRDHDHAHSFPVQSVTAAEIRASGEFSLAEVVNDIPALLSSVTAEQSLGSGFDDGANILNLRGLGAERTLVLVDGRRHVGGLQGAASVDIGSIPTPLVQRVEVLTGGASAVYGADAVTGVVNFVLRDDYDGFEVEAHYGLSEYADGEQIGVSAVWGRNLLGGRANLTVALDLRDDDGLQVDDRSDGRLIGSARDWVNPDLRFQREDIGAATPNFARYYDYANTGLIRYGLPIPTAEDFAADFIGAFGAAPELTAAEIALIERAANAPQRAVLPGRAFPITSGYGHVVPGNPFTGQGFDPEVDIDLDGNDVPDCLDSFTGYNSVFGNASRGVVGGCWSIGADGTYRPVRDGLVAGSFQGFGGDSFDTIRHDGDDLVLPSAKAAISVTGNVEVNPQTRLFGEFKYVTQETATDARPNSFWDLLFGAADNPFIPGFLRGVADSTGGIAITVDPVFFDARRTTERETLRAVGGIEGEWTNGWAYGLSLNHGRYRQRTPRDRPGHSRPFLRGHRCRHGSGDRPARVPGGHRSAGARDEHAVSDTRLSGRLLLLHARCPRLRALEHLGRPGRRLARRGGLGDHAGADRRCDRAVRCVRRGRRGVRATPVAGGRGPSLSSARSSAGRRPARSTMPGSAA